MSITTKNSSICYKKYYEYLANEHFSIFNRKKIVPIKKLFRVYITKAYDIV